SPTASGPYYSLHRCVVLGAAAAASPHETALPLPAANFDGGGHTTSQIAQPAFRVTTVEFGRPLFLIYDTQRMAMVYRSRWPLQTSWTRMLSFGPHPITSQSRRILCASNKFFFLLQRADREIDTIRTAAQCDAKSSSRGHGIGASTASMVSVLRHHHCVSWAVLRKWWLLSLATVPSAYKNTHHK
ncbi:hypothetical protein CCUS01_04596, partial [Colletotrichum cuscutae]